MTLTADSGRSRRSAFSNIYIAMAPPKELPWSPTTSVGQSEALRTANLDALMSVLVSLCPIIALPPDSLSLCGAVSSRPGIQAFTVSLF